MRGRLTTTARSRSAGQVAPPCLAIVPVWESLQEAATHGRARGGAAAGRARRPGHPDLDARSRPGWSCAPGRRLSASTQGVRHDRGAEDGDRDGDGRLLNEQYVTEFYRGHLRRQRRAASRRPTTGCPNELAESEPAAERPPIRIAEDQTRATAEASGDHNAFHLDPRVRRAAGLPGIIVHGLCLMAFAGRAVLASQEIEHPAAIQRPRGPLLAADDAGRRAHHPGLAPRKRRRSGSTPLDGGRRRGPQGRVSPSSGRRTPQP